MTTFDDYLSEGYGYTFKIHYLDPKDEREKEHEISFTMPGKNSTDAARDAIDHIWRKGWHICRLEVTKKHP